MLSLQHHHGAAMLPVTPTLATDPSPPSLTSTTTMQPTAPALAQYPHHPGLDPGGAQGAGRYPPLLGPAGLGTLGNEWFNVLTSLELRLPRTYLARARGDSGSSRSSSGGSRRRSADGREGSIPPALASARLRLPLQPGDGGESAQAGQRAPPIKGAAGLRGLCPPPG